MLTDPTTIDEFQKARDELKAKGWTIGACGNECDHPPVSCEPSFAQFCSLSAVHAEDKFEHASRYYKDSTSYGLKHISQQEHNVYCNNGTFIVFMHSNGFQFKMNVFFKLKMIKARVVKRHRGFSFYH